MVTRDASHMTDQLEALERELNAARKKNALFPNYLAGLSHDIRTPLNAIVGFAGLMGDADLDQDQVDFYSTMITRSSRKLLTMISNLIDLAKIETDNIHLFFERMSIGELFEELKEEMVEERRIYDKSSIDLLFQAPSNGSSFITSDRSRLFQVLKILMDNSLKYTNSGRISLIARSGKENQIHFIIQDTGAGMNEDTRNALFTLFPVEVSDEPMVKLKTRGLGMLVVYKLVELMGGLISVESALGKGTTITITLPRAQDVTNK